MNKSAQNFKLEQWATEAVYELTAKSILAGQVHRRCVLNPLKRTNLVHIEPPSGFEDCEKLPVAVSDHCYVELNMPASDKSLKPVNFSELHIQPAMRELASVVDRLILEEAYCGIMGSVFRHRRLRAFARDTVKITLEESLKLTKDSKIVVVCGPISETEILMSDGAVDFYRDDTFDFFLDCSVDDLCKGASIAWAPDALVLATSPLRSSHAPGVARTVVADHDGICLQASAWERDERLLMRFDLLIGARVVNPFKIVVFQDKEE